MAAVEAQIALSAGEAKAKNAATPGEDLVAQGRVLKEESRVHAVGAKAAGRQDIMGQLGPLRQGKKPILD
jgi:hypothetical protein